MKNLMLVTLALISLTLASPAYACEAHKEIAHLELVQKELAAKAQDNSSKEKATDLAKQISEIKKEADQPNFDKEKVCKKIAELKKIYNIQ